MSRGIYEGSQEVRRGREKREGEIKGGRGKIKNKIYAVKEKKGKKDGMRWLERKCREI